MQGGGRDAKRKLKRGADLNTLYGFWSLTGVGACRRRISGRPSALRRSSQYAYTSARMVSRAAGKWSWGRLVGGAGWWGQLAGPRGWGQARSGAACPISQRQARDASRAKEASRGAQRADIPNLRAKPACKAQTQPKPSPALKLHAAMQARRWSDAPEHVSSSICSASSRGMWSVAAHAATEARSAGAAPLSVRTRSVAAAEGERGGVEGGQSGGWLEAGEDTHYKACSAALMALQAGGRGGGGRATAWRAAPFRSLVTQPPTRVCDLEAPQHHLELLLAEALRLRMGYRIKESRWVWR
jgi:hypothetical protein